ncbi:unnamed protein product [Calypogeia fissa]
MSTGGFGYSVSAVRQIVSCLGEVKMWWGGMEDPVAVAIVLGAAVLLVLSWAVLNSSGKGSSRAKIPRGSRGWPLIGETLAFANADPLEFTAPRVKKYGPVFRSHIVGVPSVIVTTPDMARFVYSEKTLFRASYPSNIATLVGRKSLSNCEPGRHPFLKKLVHSVLLPETIRHEVGRSEGFVLDTLNSWGDGKIVQTTAEMKELTLYAAVYTIFGITHVRGSPEAQILVDAYQELSKAFYAIPINLPGFTWYTALKSKQRACDYVATLIAKSRKDAEEGKECNSVLRELVVAVDEKGNKLENDEIMDVLVGALFGAHDTTATSLTWIIKFLTENPDIRKAIVAEQEEIARLKELGSPLTWEHTRKMHLTHQVIQETLRYPTILQFTARAALQDVEYKGYLIPKGWRVFVMTTSIHLDPAIFASPTKFDPSRFKAAPKLGTYLPFGSGTHVCPGNELAKLNMCTFIHHFTTKFSWKAIQPDAETEFKPFALPKGGYPIEVHRHVKAH